MTKYASRKLCQELYEATGIRFVPVVGLEERFLVSEHGKIVSLPSRTGKGKERSVYTNKFGYQSINYIAADGKRKNLMVHRAVAEAFVPNVNFREQVNHKDGNKANNHYTNLEWCTPKENTSHAIATGLSDITRTQGSKHGMAKLNESKVRRIMTHKGRFSARTVSEWFSVSDQTIRDIWNGRRWRHVQHK